MRVAKQSIKHVLVAFFLLVFLNVAMGAQYYAAVGMASAGADLIFGPELLINSGMEEVLGVDIPDPLPDNWSYPAVPVGWTTWILDNTDAQFEVTNEEVHRGQLAVKLTGSVNAVLQQIVSLEKGERYVFSGYVKAKGTEDVRIGVDIRTEDDFYQYAHRERVSIPETGLTGERWIRLTHEFVVPENGNADSIQILFSVLDQEEGGYAYFDSATLRRILPPDEISELDEAVSAPDITFLSDQPYTFPFFIGEHPLAVIVADSDSLRAAHELRDTLEKMSGISLPVLVEEPVDALFQVHVGHTHFVRSLGIDWDSIDMDGFVARTVRDDMGVTRLVLAGPRPLATEFAVYRFLYRYGGVRWYLPTDLGEHVPKRDAFGLESAIDEIEEPDFLSRAFYIATTFDGGLWERRNLMAGNRFSFNHNLWRIFNPAVYEEHPEWFYQQPTGTSADAYISHSCLSNPEVARFAGQAAARYFEQNPNATSYSLAINDTGRNFCPEDLALAKGTFRGYPDLSDVVFTFLNQAAEELVKTHPDKYIGALAYHASENIPSFNVHPNVIPYLTSDRSQWYDPDFKEEDKELMERWSQVSPNFGIWDYYYGRGFIIPRVYFQVTNESLKHAKANNIIGFFAELISNWSLDGPKAWLVAQLLWDTDQDFDTLLNDFYTNFFEEASEPMRAYFELMEEQWMNQPGEARWLKLRFDYDQLELMPPEVIHKAKKHLNEAASLAGSETAQRRVQLIADAFRLTELYANHYHTWKSLQFLEIETMGDFERISQAYVTFPLTKRELDEHYETVIELHPLHRPYDRFEDSGRARNLAEVPPISAMMQLKTWADENGRSDLAQAFLRQVQQVYAGEAPSLYAGALLRTYQQSGVD